MIIGEKIRRSMFKAFLEICDAIKIIEINEEILSLTDFGRQNVEANGRTPLWLSQIPPFKESQRIEGFKALYYATGNQFRDVVKQAFIELGFQAEAFPDNIAGLPDIKIAYGDFKAVLETKGEIKQIGENDVNQLTKAETKRECEGNNLIFVGNAFRLKLPEQRGEFFHKDAIKLAESKSILLISSLALIDALEKKWKGETNADLIAKRLHKKGIF